MKKLFFASAITVKEYMEERLLCLLFDLQPGQDRLKGIDKGLSYRQLKRSGTP